LIVLHHARFSYFSFLLHPKRWESKEDRSLPSLLWSTLDVARSTRRHWQYLQGDNNK
jgi:hypothetical protein